MPPISNDDQAQALHVLSVVQAALALDNVLALAGGPERASMAAVRPQIRALQQEVARLVLFLRGAGTHGLVPAHNAQRIAEAINALRKSPVLSAEDARSAALNESERADLFSVDDGTGA